MVCSGRQWRAAEPSPSRAAARPLVPSCAVLLSCARVCLSCSRWCVHGVVLVLLLLCLQAAAQARRCATAEMLASSDPERLKAAAVWSVCRRLFCVTCRKPNHGGTTSSTRRWHVYRLPWALQAQACCVLDRILAVVQRQSCRLLPVRLCRTPQKPHWWRRSSATQNSTRQERGKAWRAIWAHVQGANGSDPTLSARTAEGRSRGLSP